MLGGQYRGFLAQDTRVIFVEGHADNRVRTVRRNDRRAQQPRTWGSACSWRVEYNVQQPGSADLGGGQLEPRECTLTIDPPEGAGALLRGAQQRDPYPGRAGDQADWFAAALGRDLQLRGFSGAMVNAQDHVRLILTGVEFTALRVARQACILKTCSVAGSSQSSTSWLLDCWETNTSGTPGSLTNSWVCAADGSTYSVSVRRCTNKAARSRFFPGLNGYVST